MNPRFKRPVIRRRRRIVRGRRTRIRIPQPEDRPIQLHQRDLIRGEAMRPSTWWFIKHRRGVKRTKVGEDPLEQRAVSEKSVEGFLRERIVYKYLVHRLRLIPNVDFTFQSSREGGRMELGGMVVDFLFEIRRLALRVQGPHHDRHLQALKDEEQKEILESMGYTVEDLMIEEIDDEYEFESRMRTIFGLASVGMGSSISGGRADAYDKADEGGIEWLLITKRLSIIESTVGALAGK